MMRTFAVDKSTAMQTVLLWWVAALTTIMPGHRSVKDPVVRLVKYQVNAGNCTTFREALRTYIFTSIKAPGNIMAEAYYEENDSTTLWTVERWTDSDALNKNAESKAAKAIVALTKHALVTPADTLFMNDLEPLAREEYHKQPAAGDVPLTIMLFVDAKPGTEEEFKKLYHAAMPAFRSEAGVIAYQLSQLSSDKTKFVTYEKFRSQQAFEYHLQFPPVEPVVQYLRTSIKEQPFEKGLHRLIELAPYTKNKNY